jgi:hypothetical protein
MTLAIDDIRWRSPDLARYCLPSVAEAGAKLETLSASLSERIRPALSGLFFSRLMSHLAESLSHHAICAMGELEDCPRIQHALDQLSRNFVHNIELACRRLEKDWNDISKLFFLPDGVVVLSLEEVTPAGSESRKGGLQDLILTFKTQGQGQARLLYRPTDVELDLRLVGQTQGIGKRGHTLSGLKLEGLPESLQHLSLIERLNGLSGFLTLPTHRVLPRNPGSELGEGPALPIRESYGYIEYLSNLPLTDFSGEPFVWFEPEKSDWVFESEPQLARYFLECGGLLAVASAFAFVDLTSRNVVVHGRRPHALDLEGAFAGPGGSPSQTGLLTDITILAGICGQRVLEFRIDRNELVPSQSRVRYQGRDVSLHASTVCSRQLFHGYLHMMQVLRRNLDVIQVYLSQTGLERCVARYSVFNTLALFRARQRLYGRENCTRPMPDDAHMWEVCNELAPEGRSPLELAALYHLQTRQDLLNGDVPAYYHRLGSHCILDSRGEPLRSASGGLELLQVPTLRAVQKQHLSLTGEKEFRDQVSKGVREIARVTRDTSSFKIEGFEFTLEDPRG